MSTGRMPKRQKLEVAKKSRKKCKAQRAERGYSDQDACDIENWFMETMLCILQQMRDNIYGYPESPETDPSAPRVVVLPREKEPEGMIRWKGILDRMIFLLKEMNEKTCRFDNSGMFDNPKLRKQQMFQYRDRCKNEFFLMLSKYYWALWN